VLNLNVTAGPFARPAASWSGGFTLSDDDAVTLRDNRVAVDNVTPDSLAVDLRRP
jgi:hypothetical protein